MLLGEMVFDDLTVIEVPVKIGDKQYFLREASEDVAVQYRNACARAARFSDNGKISGIEGIGDVEPLLVSLCLFEKLETGEKPVSIKAVRAMKSKVVKALFERTKEISDLNETEDKGTLLKRLEETQAKLNGLNREEAKLKNSSSATTATSV